LETLEEVCKYWKTGAGNGKRIVNTGKREKGAGRAIILTGERMQRFEETSV
jgi:hypothetical protein